MLTSMGLVYTDLTLKNPRNSELRDTTTGDGTVHKVPYADPVEVIFEDRHYLSKKARSLRVDLESVKWMNLELPSSRLVCD